MFINENHITEQHSHIIGDLLGYSTQVLNLYLYPPSTFLSSKYKLATSVVYQVSFLFSPCPLHAHNTWNAKKNYKKNNNNRMMSESLVKTHFVFRLRM